MQDTSNETNIDFEFEKEINFLLSDAKDDQMPESAVVHQQVATERNVDVSFCPLILIFTLSLFFNL